jgi:HAD superfamily hydrolase (TIGR01509 family)
MIRAILIDVGGPILDEEADFIEADRILASLIQREGIDVGDDAFQAARRHAIDTYSPSYNSATIWQFVAPDMDRFRRIRADLTTELRRMRTAPTIRPDARDVLVKLTSNFNVVLAGNQPREVRAALDEGGIADVCTDVLLSDDFGVFKPDTRFFLTALSAAGVTAQEAIMVGDRLDNDIYPANILGMRTIRILTGPFSVQQPRTPRDIPHATIRSIDELPDAVSDLALSGE